MGENRGGRLLRREKTKGLRSNKNQEIVSRGGDRKLKEKSYKGTSIEGTLCAGLWSERRE